MFQDQWYVPQGESWAALFLKDAKLIIYGETKGTGILAF
jgi:iron complex transport system substrate-binding protein